MRISLRIHWTLHIAPAMLAPIAQIVTALTRLAVAIITITHGRWPL